MATIIEQSGSAARQVSGKDPQGKYILSVIATRSYAFNERGQWGLAPEQRPLTEDLQPDKENPDLLASDSDLHPYKPRTDIVVKGHAHGIGGPRQLDVLIQIGAATKRITVFGDRQCTLTAAGKLLFSTAAPITKIPLAYSHAYGGRDMAAEKQRIAKFGPPAAKFGFDFGQAIAKGRVTYPRNPCGKGYLIKASAEALESLKLPNLEDPADLLTPERLEVGETLRWPKMPLPQATAWLPYEWFPRICCTGFMPVFAPKEAIFAEQSRGLIPETVFRNARSDNPDVFSITCGASPGLQVPYLRGDEPMNLQNVHAKLSAISLKLPGDRPRIWTDGRKGKMNKTDPVIQTVLIEPDEMRVSIVWRGSAPALRPYMPEELKKMPLKVEWPS